jgi:hypothetical protein
LALLSHFTKDPPISNDQLLLDSPARGDFPLSKKTHVGVYNIYEYISA